MEQWQFLIQKEGERTWHPLEKPNVEITEGRYRVVARSNRTNTDVEVRVTHSSPSEVPPIRRIQKRIRRVNSEGLTAIIPFTYLKSGLWELQCSGDLMSDLLGASWQYTVNLAVIPFSIEGKIISPTKPNHNSDKQYKVASEDIQTNQTNLVKSKIKDAQSNRYPVSSKDFKTNDAGLISSISIETAANIGSNSSITGKLTSTPPNTGKKAVSDQEKGEKPADKLRESLRAAEDKQKAVTKNRTQKSTSKVSKEQNKVVSEIPTQKLAEKAKGLPEIAVNASPAEKQTASIVTSNKPVNKKPFPKSLESNTATSNQKDVSEKTVKKSAQKPKKSKKKDVNKKPLRKEVTAITKQNSNPVRIKGDTAEQILQNLMELALPSSEPLLADDSIENALTAPPLLPLLITLDQDSHVASWGSTITLEGVIQLKETTDPQIKQITSAEVEIELRSPQNSQLLQSFRLPNPNKSLPFAIASLINIPEECPSKLILGEVKLYGALSQSGVVELLASQSFTITAEIKELLAITVANPKGELEKFACSTEEYFAQNAPQILEESASLDLELFNLVKTVKPEQQSVTRVKSTKNSLPPRIDPRKLRRRVVTHPLKLPSVPGYQEKIDEYINNGYIENFSGSAITGTSFPFLRKSIPSRLVEVDEDVDRDEESTHTSATESQEIAQTSSQIENSSQAELVVDEKDDYMEEFEEPVTPRNSELIAGENLNTSPLIRQWMLSQGYTVPEPIDVEYEDYDIEVRQQISYQNPQDNNSQVLQPEKAQIDIQAAPSPYISISTSSQWQVNQITAPSTQIAQEIVLDDTDIFADDILNAENSQPDAAADDKTENSSSSALTISTQKLEYLPIPELYVQQGELISGKSLSVRVRLPEGNPHLAVKLWLEDCQTRHLLDGLHLLTNLTPNKNQQLEIITKLNVPFGCLEIRLEAVAINRSTQQESHKFTIQRTVIPPDLPAVQLDAMLGM
ncbi:hypothetical protein [Calothrix sp. CCY 0018]|uniref:hypothetical protein n=1 Tax=Calothrix sp. CCY 0018 TaxID=3103864 RepID=UPI0039C6DEF3